jgi:hypothetical protein
MRRRTEQVNERVVVTATLLLSQKLPFLNHPKHPEICVKTLPILLANS